MKLIDFLNIILGNNNKVPAQIANLQRIKCNVKVTWDLSPDYTTGQHIIITNKNEKLIDKVLAKNTAAFSFNAVKNSNIVISIIPMNSDIPGTPTILELIV